MADAHGRDPLSRLGSERDLAWSAPDPVLELDPAGLLRGWNPAAERMFGYAEQDVVGRSLAELLLTGQDRRGYEQLLAELRAGERRDDLRAAFVDRADEPRRVIQLRTWVDEGVVFVTARDITVDHASHLALLLNEERLRLLIDSISDYGVFMIDPEGLIATWNAGAERLKGYTEQEAVGQHFRLFYTEEQRAANHPEHELEVALETGRYEEEAWRVRKDGTLFWANVIISAVVDSQGLVRGFSKVTRDMTDRRRMEAEVEQARDLAVEAARSRQEFLANMSHEIRTPMNAVIGMTSMLLDTDLDADQREYAEMVRSSGDHLLTVINDILDYSKIDAGKLVLEHMPFAVRDWVHESLDLMALAAHDKGIEIISDIAPDVPPVVVSDPGRLRQVLVNLLSNAVKFTREGEVVVSVTLDSSSLVSSQLRVSVRDTGIGVAAARIHALFDPFTQADATTTRSYGGTGLGLAISSRIVEHMGGALTMESEPGVGTTVSFTFQGGLSELGAEVGAPDLVGRSVLVVDDNATNRLLLETWCGRYGMTVVSVDGGQAAMAAARGRSFDFGILDLMMPLMDGAELGLILRSRQPAMRLLLLSSAGPYAREIAGRGTFDALISKPVKQDALMSLMSRLVQPGTKVDEAPSRPASSFDLGVAPRLMSILVVEDNPVNLKVARHLLTRFGFRSDAAGSGNEAVAALVQREYDLVLMDVQMPDMDGLEATRVIRDRWPDRAIRIVAMTANVAPEDVQRCHEAGMDAFLGKPIALDELAAQLAAAVERLPSPVVDAVVVPTAVADSTLGRLIDQIGADNVRELVALYATDLEAAEDTLASCVAEQDRERLGATAHKVKSSSRSLGATELGDAFAAIEREAPDAAWRRLGELVEQVTGRATGAAQALLECLAAPGSARER